MQFTRCYKAGKGKPRLCAPGRVCPARRFHFAPPGLPFLPHRHFNPPNLSTLVAHTCRAPPAAGTAGRGGQAAAGKQAFTQHKGLPCRERAPVITLRPGRRHASARIPFGFTRITCPAALMTAFQPWQPDVSGSLRSMLRHPPGKAGGLRKPWKGILPAILSSGTGYSVSCITYPVSRKPGSSHYLLHLFWYRTPHLASPGTDSESLFVLPGSAWGCRFVKAKAFLRGISAGPADGLSFQRGQRRCAANFPCGESVTCMQAPLCGHSVPAQLPRPLPFGRKAGILKKTHGAMPRTSQSRMKDGTKHGTDMGLHRHRRRARRAFCGAEPAPPRQDSAGAERRRAAFGKGGACR